MSNEISLSKDADKLICLIYKHYLERRERGASKEDARILGGSDVIQAKVATGWLLEDVDDTCRELSRCGLL